MSDYSFMAPTINAKRTMFIMIFKNFETFEAVSLFGSFNNKAIA